MEVKRKDAARFGSNVEREGLNLERKSDGLDAVEVFM